MQSPTRTVGLVLLVLAGELKGTGYEVTTNVGGHGVVAVLKNGPGKTLLIRTDLDALPVKEQTGAHYASTAQAKNAAGQAVDVMHACGHDVHVTCLVGTARAMAKMKDRWKGTLVLIGQPAEEVGKGAAAMLKDGLFTRFPRPDFCLALHVDAELEAGKVGYVPGYAMANVDSVDVVIRGVGGHGAQPDKTKDPSSSPPRRSWRCKPSTAARPTRWSRWWSQSAPSTAARSTTSSPTR